jgi:4-amino-4-deoxy-L-arabinose transferase-like glycosyltransferase
VLALRLPAAVVGTLTTLPVWLLGRAWFGRPPGCWPPVLWAITLWPVHLGRIGLRAGLLAPVLALAFWLGTRGVPRKRPRWWLAAGAGLWPQLLHLSGDSLYAAAAAGGGRIFALARGA